MKETKIRSTDRNWTNYEKIGNDKLRKLRLKDKNIGRFKKSSIQGRIISTYSDNMIRRKREGEEGLK